jgi:hypothetical protein
MTLKLSSADDAAGCFHERFVNEGEAFESNAQAPEVMQARRLCVQQPIGLCQGNCREAHLGGRSGSGCQ